MKLIIHYVVYIAIMTTKATDLNTSTVNNCSAYDGVVFSNHCYYIRETAINWQQSQNYCSTLGANLVTVPSEYESGFLKNETTWSSYWIGLYKPTASGPWQWVDGTESNINKWEDGQGVGVDEQCTLAISGSEVFWHDYPCNTLAYSVCKKHVNLTQWRLVTRSVGGISFNVIMTNSHQPSVHDTSTLQYLVVALSVWCIRC